MTISHELIRRARERLFTAAVSDTLDEMGLMHQVMGRQLRPLDEELVLCGRARTGSYIDVYRHIDDDDPYELDMALAEGLGSEDVVVLACGKSGRIAPWGGLRSVAARQRGAVGCVTDGLARDVRLIRELRFPMFASGIGALQLRERGHLEAIDVPVACAGVWVSPGDLIFGDVDGVVVIPQGVAETAVRSALKRVEAEQVAYDRLQQGCVLREVYAIVHPTHVPPAPVDGSGNRR